MTTETQPHSPRPIAGNSPRTPVRRSDEPYSSVLEEEIDPSGEMPTSGRQRAPRISREEVFATADALLLEGIRPTIDRVRVRLGRGSPNTINEFMDAWWAKLGSRLRDLPGREFPQLPERVASSLQKLWNEALEAAHDILESTRAQQGEHLSERQRALEAEQQTLQQERLTHAARSTALEEALQLARSQLEESNHRARGLEQAVVQREGELRQTRAELDRLARELATFRTQQDAERQRALEERTRLQEHFESNERRWITELDRARQGLKAAELIAREMQNKVAKLTDEREVVRAQLQQLRGELATAAAVREQLESRLKIAEARGAKSGSPRTRRTRSIKASPRRKA